MGIILKKITAKTKSEVSKLLLEKPTDKEKKNEEEPKSIKKQLPESEPETHNSGGVGRKLSLEYQDLSPNNKVHNFFH